MSTNMEEKPVSDSEQINPLGHLTRQQLKGTGAKGKNTRSENPGPRYYAREKIPCHTIQTYLYRNNKFL